LFHFIRAAIFFKMPEPKLIDLSHTIEHGMVTYKGLPAPIICDYLSREASRAQYAPGTEFQIGKIEMIANTGTYLDCPFHRYADGDDLSQLKLEAVTDLDCVVVRTANRRARAIDRIPIDLATLKGKALLFHTGWDIHWRTDQYFEDHPHLTGTLAHQLVEAGVTLVGIDSFNIDSIDDGTRPVHSALLGAGILIVEHMCGLSAVPDQGARFFAIPVKVKGMGSFPVRAFAKL
jgi:kynurenine formamidase